MEGMVTDLQLAREKQQNFDEWKQRKNKQLPIDLSVTVLTTGMSSRYAVPFVSKIFCACCFVLRSLAWGGVCGVVVFCALFVKW
jgi:hypothetical protein